MGAGPRQRKLELFISELNPLWKDIEALELKHKVRINECAVSDVDHQGAAHAFVSTGASVEPGSTGAKRKVRHHSFKPSKTFYLLDHSDQTHQNWKSGTVSDRNGLVPSIRTLAASLRLYGERVDPDASALARRVEIFLQELDMRPDFTVYEAGKALGMDMLTSMRAFDLRYVRARPVLSNTYYKDEQAADSARRRIGRLFRLYLRRRSSKRVTKQDTFWMCGGLHLRYSIKVEGGWLLRVKMHLPRIQPTAVELEASKKLGRGDPYVEYDGVVHLSGTHVTWLLEQRKETDPGNDYFTMITSNPLINFDGAATLDSRPTFAGRYLTSNQDNERSVVSDVMFLQSVDAVSDPEDLEARIKRVMWFDNHVLREGQPPKKSDPAMAPFAGIDELDGWASNFAQL